VEYKYFQIQVFAAAFLHFHSNLPRSKKKEKKLFLDLNNHRHEIYISLTYEPFLSGGNLDFFLSKIISVTLRALESLRYH
jgi:hypothetical protein